MTLNRKKREIKKRTGKIGPVVFSKEGIEFQPIKFPEKKEEIESYIVELTIKGLEAIGENFYNLEGYPFQNPENDFDFTLPTKSGVAFLELMEVAALENVKGTYEDAPASYNCGNMADNIYSKIMKKSNKYGASSRVHLLLYTTDFRFRLNEHVLALITFWCLKNKHSFQTILYVLIEGERRIEAKILYPVPAENFAKFNEQNSRNRTILLWIPTELKEIDKNTADIPLGAPTEK